MVDIATISHGAYLGLLYDIYHIARSILRLIGEGHCFVTHDEEASISHGPSIRPPTSSTVVKMQSIRGRGRGRGRGGGRPGEVGGGRLGGYANSHPTDETYIPPKYSTPTPETSISPKYSTPPLETFISHEYSTPPPPPPPPPPLDFYTTRVFHTTFETFIPLEYSTLPPKTSAPHVIPPLPHTSPVLEATCY